MKVAIALLALLTPALAQTAPDWSNGACYADGVYWPARPFNQCVTADRQLFAQTAPPDNMRGVITGAFSSNATVSNKTPSCPEDRTPVMIRSGRLKCAKDLTNPD